jgi:hypothetical protein
MSLDLDAFLHACSDCMRHNPLRNKAVVRIPHSSTVTQMDSIIDDDPHLSEVSSVILQQILSVVLLMKIIEMHICIFRYCYDCTVELI